MSEPREYLKLWQILPWYGNAGFFCYGFIVQHAYLMAFSGVILIVMTILMKDRIPR